MFLFIEFILCIAAVLASFLVPDLGETWFSKIEGLLNRLAQRRGWAVVAVGLSALALRAALLPVAPIPAPQVHDEFSYLLMGDTFAHGRLANPTHPMWMHFETFHVNQQPRYVSMFYPAQGVFLAAGQVIFGNPFWGVWLSVGIMCAAICWMLQAWVAPFWALLGGLLAVIRLGTFSYWANSYWGGAVAAIGGALVLGGFPRIKKDCRTRDAVLMGLGFVILASSRPYEGLFLSVPVLAYLIKWLWDNKSAAKGVMPRVVLPLCLVVGLGVGGMLYYFWRTTGSSLITPYVINLRSYNPIPYFPWQSVRQIPEYRYAEMRNFYLGWVLDQYEFARLHPVRLILIKAFLLEVFFLGFALLPPFLVSVMTARHRIRSKWSGQNNRLLVHVAFWSALALLLPVFVNIHYAAPLTGAIYIILLLVMRRTSRWRIRSVSYGVAIIRFTVASCVLLFFVRVCAPILSIPVSTLTPTWGTPPRGLPDRSNALAEIGKDQKDLLVIVRYHVSRTGDMLFSDWVYNGADIDKSRIIWARDMGPQRNQELLDYFRGREAWLVEPDESPVRVTPYSSSVISQGERAAN